MAPGLWGLDRPSVGSDLQAGTLKTEKARDRVRPSVMTSSPGSVGAIVWRKGSLCVSGRGDDSFHRGLRGGSWPAS